MRLTPVSNENFKGVCRKEFFFVGSVTKNFIERLKRLKWK